MIFKTHISDLLAKDLNAVKAHLESHREKLGNIKFLDLLLEHYDTGKVRGMDHGVYLFFNAEGKCAYVGKTNNRNFAERLSAHFGMRHKHMGNVYLDRTLRQNPGGKKGKLEPNEYSAMVNKMHDHSISLINVYGWNSIKKAISEAGGDPEKFEGKVRRNKKIWGKETFVNELEKTLQAIYCPPPPPGKPEKEEDHFLVMQKRGRVALRRRKKNICGEAKAGEPFAKLIAISSAPPKNRRKKHQQGE